MLSGLRPLTAYSRVSETPGSTSVSNKGYNVAQELTSFSILLAAFSGFAEPE